MNVTDWLLAMDTIYGGEKIHTSRSDTLRAPFVYAEKIKVRYFLNRPRSQNKNICHFWITVINVIMLIMPHMEESNSFVIF